MDEQFEQVGRDLPDSDAALTDAERDLLSQALLSGTPVLEPDLAERMLATAIDPGTPDPGVSLVDPSAVDPFEDAGVDPGDTTGPAEPSEAGDRHVDLRSGTAEESGDGDDDDGPFSEDDVYEAFDVSWGSETVADVGAPDQLTDGDGTEEAGP